jgi:hypothetical protein
MGNIDENIANSLGIEPTKEIVRPPVSVPAVVREYEKSDSDKDYAEVRTNLKCIIEKSQEAIEGIIELAQDSQQPRAYEVVAQLIQSSLEANTKLMDLHRRMKDINREDQKAAKITNNSIYVGSTAELQKLIRDQKKAIASGEVIDMEGEEKDG